MKTRHAFLAAAIPLLAMSAGAMADTAPAVPGPGFDGGRYGSLWTKSPFAIATPDAPAASSDYQLVGMAQFDGVSYVTLIDKQSSEHFVLASNQPVKNLSLVSISRGKDGASAVVLRNGESLTLRQEEGTASPPFSTPMQQIMQPQPVIMPAPNNSVGGMSPMSLPQRVRFHHLPIRVPPPPQ